MSKLVLEKVEKPENKLPTSPGSLKKQECSRKTSISALLIMPKPLTVWITKNYENSSRDENTRPSDLPPEKPVCRSRINSQNWTWNNRLVSQEAGNRFWYSYLFKNLPQFVVIHTVKGFVIVSEAEVDDFLECPSFCYGPTDVDNLISGSSAFSKSNLYIWKFSVHILLKPCRILRITLLACEMNTIIQ